MPPQTENQTIAIHISPDISRSKSNLAMKFSQLTEWNWNIFLENSYTKYGIETIPRPFVKK